MPAPVEVIRATDSEQGRFECTLNITGVNTMNINGGVHITERRSTAIDRVESQSFIWQPSGTDSELDARSPPEKRIHHPTLSNNLEDSHVLPEEVTASGVSDDSDGSRASSVSIYSDSIFPLCDRSEVDLPNTTSGTSTSQLQPSVHLIFELKHLAPDNLAKVERLTRALHSGFDEWAIMLRERCSSTRYVIVGVGSASLLGFHNEDIWTMDVNATLKAMRKFNALKKASLKNQWRIVWKPSDHANAVRRIGSLDDAIEWVEQSERVHPHPKKPSSEKDWNEAREEARRETTQLVNRFWICCACYPKDVRRDRSTELWHLKNAFRQTTQCDHTRCNDCVHGTGFGREEVQKALIEWEFQKNGCPIPNEAPPFAVNDKGLPPNCVPVFENTKNQIEKLFAFVHALQTNADNFSISISLHNVFDSMRIIGVGIPAVPTLSINCADIRRRDSSQLNHILQQWKISKFQWSILWGPKVELADVAKLGDLDAAIEWVSNPLNPKQ
ncbi:hypothetical protein N431DRAFT_445412 [Stipitochalara longipes BDJ]|nr:hypothetical protein N431DRAFT_445412 [Stipitochalara longipes BDJ]